MGYKSNNIKSLNIYKEKQCNYKEVNSLNKRLAWIRKNHHLIVSDLIKRIEVCFAGPFDKCRPPYIGMSFLALEDKGVGNHDFREELAWISKSQGEQIKPPPYGPGKCEYKWLIDLADPEYL